MDKDYELQIRAVRLGAYPIIKNAEVTAALHYRG